MPFWKEAPTLNEEKKWNKPITMTEAVKLNMQRSHLKDTRANYHVITATLLLCWFHALKIITVGFVTEKHCFTWRKNTILTVHTYPYGFSLYKIQNVYAFLLFACLSIGVTIKLWYAFQWSQVNMNCKVLTKILETKHCLHSQVVSISFGARVWFHTS